MDERGVRFLYHFATKGVFLIYERNSMASVAIAVNEDFVKTHFVQKNNVTGHVVGE